MVSLSIVCTWPDVQKGHSRLQMPLASHLNWVSNAWRYSPSSLTRLLREETKLLFLFRKLYLLECGSCRETWCTHKTVEIGAVVLAK